MWRVIHACTLLVSVALWCIVPQLRASDPPVKVIAHPSRTETVTRAELRAIYLKQKLFWSDGRPIVPVNREAGSRDREEFSQRVFGQDSRRLAGYWNQRYFEAGEFPPPTLASQEAVTRFVASNPDAIGYVLGDEVAESVTVVLTLE